jgi:hypothetical protein
MNASIAGFGMVDRLARIVASMAITAPYARNCGRRANSIHFDIASFLLGVAAGAVVIVVLIAAALKRLMLI